MFKHDCAKKKTPQKDCMCIILITWFASCWFIILKFARYTGVINCVRLRELKLLMILIARFQMHNPLFQKKN